VFVLVAVALGIGAVASGCYSSESTAGPQAYADIFLGGTKVSGEAAPTLTVTPGATATIDLAKTLLMGKVGPKVGGVKSMALSKCIAEAEWSVVKADGTPLGAPYAGRQTWPVGTGNSADVYEWADGARDRTIAVPIPADVTGLSLTVAVFSAVCTDKGCSSATPRRGVRGLPIIGERKDSQRWITGQVAVKLVAYVPTPGPAPTPGPDDGPALSPQLVVAQTPISTSSSWGTRMRELNARMLAAPSGASTYEWDLNGDGVYGDSSAASDRTLPVGVAVVPAGNLPTASTLEVGVRVTGSGGYDVTKRASIRTVGAGGCSNPGYRCGDYVGLSTESPVAGSPLTVTVNPVFAFGRTSSERACLDLNGNGFFEKTVDVSPSEVTAQFVTSALPVGAHLIQTAFVDTTVSCADAPAQANAYIYRNVYVSQLSVTSAESRQGATTYSGAATMRLSKTITIKPAQQVGYEVKNEILRGRYAFATPKTGRPAGLSAFTAGDYVQKIDAIRLTPNATGTETTVTGTGTMLLRGKKGALLCTTIDSSAVATTYVFAGGKGAGASVTGGMSSPPLDFKGTWERASGLKVIKGVQTQTKPIVEQGTIAAGTGATRALPAACKALVRYLPKPAKAAAK